MHCLTVSKSRNTFMLKKFLNSQTVSINIFDWTVKQFQSQEIFWVEEVFSWTVEKYFWMNF